ncbi:MAG: universal stress protein [Desulfobacteraceae bacterium]|nr:universal stress protein [Desulfobacteraceae bacterium]
MIDPLRDISNPQSAPLAESPGAALVAMGKALVAIKDSNPALHAFTQTMEMSRRLGFPVAAVTVAPAYEGDLGLSTAGSSRAAGNDPSRVVLDEALDIAMSEGLGLETFRATGLAHLAVLQMLQGSGFGLVVLGRDRRWTSPLNTAAHVVRQSPVDVLVIPEERPMRFRHIVCGAIGLPVGPVLDTAAHLASLDNGRVTLLTLANESGIQEIGVSGSTPVKVQTVNSPRALNRELREAARQLSTDLIVFAEAPARGIWNALGLPWAVRLLMRSHCALWVVKI